VAARTGEEQSPTRAGQALRSKSGIESVGSGEKDVDGVRSQVRVSSKAEWDPAGVREEEGRWPRE